MRPPNDKELRESFPPPSGQGRWPLHAEKTTPHMSDEYKAYQATPALTLERQIMDPNVPKNDREWWAASEIEHLQAKLWDLHAMCNGSWFLRAKRVKKIVRAALRRDIL